MGGERIPAGGWGERESLFQTTVWSVTSVLDSLLYHWQGVRGLSWKGYVATVPLSVERKSLEELIPSVLPLLKKKAREARTRWYRGPFRRYQILKVVLCSVLLPVDHSNASGNSGSLHEGCRVLHVVQAADKLPRHQSLHRPDLTPQVVL